jgi:hypothetical protein
MATAKDAQGHYINDSGLRRTRVPVYQDVMDRCILSN